MPAMIRLFSLCGLTFTRGMVSKEIILGLSLSTRINFVCILGILLVVFSTFIYSLYIWVSLHAKSLQSSIHRIHSRFSLLVSSVLLSVISLIVVGWLSRNLLNPPYRPLYTEVKLSLVYVILSLLGVSTFSGGLSRVSILTLVSNTLSGLMVYKRIRFSLLLVKVVEELILHSLILLRVVFKRLSIQAGFIDKGLTRNFFLILVFFLIII